MLPAWMSKLKDLKAKQKQPKNPFLSSSSSTSKGSADKKLPANFAKALSLQKANSRARSARLEAELGYLTGSKDSDSIFSSSDNDIDSCMLSSGTCIHSSSVHTCARSSTDSCLHTSKLTCIHSPTHTPTDTCMLTSTHACMLSSTHKSTGSAAAASKLQSYDNAEVFNTAEEVVLFSTDCRDFKCDFNATASCDIKVSPQLHKSLEVPCVQYGVIDNDTEDSNALTPDTIESSFGSETSSGGSSTMHKCGYVEESRRRLLLWQEGGVSSGLENLACSMDMEAMSRPSYLEMSPSLRKLQKSSSPNMAEHHSLTDLEETCHERVFHSTGCSDSVPGFCNESNSSIVKIHSPLSTHREERDRHVSNVSSMDGYGAAENSSRGESQVSIVKDLKAVPNVWQERSIFAGTQLCSFSYSKWEERSVLIAAENPGLMLSSQWQARSSSTSLQTGANEESNASGGCRIDLLTCEHQDTDNGLSTCESQDKIYVLNHSGMRDAYLRKGRRHRASSFSAALPKDLQGVVGDSIALVKMSHNPYDDFRQSMYEMIMEKDLEESMDVEELLYCYLTLNPPELHDLIEEVFSDVWSLILMSVR